LLNCLFSDSDWQHGNDALLRKVISLFNDCPLAPLSIHKLTTLGAAFGKPLGGWFGPSTISQVIKQLVNTNPSLPLRVYNAVSTTISPQEINRLCGGNSEDPNFQSQWERSLLLLVPTRLGVSGVNPVYFPTLTAYMQLPQSLGFVGGKPNFAYYFMATQGENLFYLDPHTTQPTIIVNEGENTNLDSYSCSIPKMMSMSGIDESLALGFFCRDNSEWQQLQQSVAALTLKEDFCPLFTFETPAHSYSMALSGASLRDDFDMTCSLNASLLADSSINYGFELMKETPVSLNPDGEDFDL